MQTVSFPFENTYTQLPTGFYSPVSPRAVSAPKLVKLNESLALELGLDAQSLSTPEGAAILTGKQAPEGAAFVALAYAGHQFGHFVPQLGDGRALLLGEVVTPDGKRRDIHLKGSGTTRFSRGGDGLAALGPVLREYVVSEAMAALGIPTTRALAVATTGEVVRRERYLPGAVLARVAESHIRVGTFEYFAARGDTEAVRRLADYTIERHYPEAAKVDGRYRALLDGVVLRQAHLVARWMLVGFIHGVMNTDNMLISGETIDYGPCAFLDVYDPKTVFSSIDHYGRYAYRNQPAIAEWNLTRLAECLLPLLGDEKQSVDHAQEALSSFSNHFNEAYLTGFRRKIGLFRDEEGDLELVQSLLDRMAANQADFTLTFRRLSDAAVDDRDQGARNLFIDPGCFDGWAGLWQSRIRREPAEAGVRSAAMRRVNPGFIPRNHRVEEMITAAVEFKDFSPFEELLSVLSRPFDDQPSFTHYADPPAGDRSGYRTFCGT